MDNTLETSTERLRHHLRRPLAGSRNLLMKTAENTVPVTDPSGWPVRPGDSTGGAGRCTGVRVGSVDTVRAEGVAGGGTRQVGRGGHRLLGDQVAALPGGHRP